MGINMSRSSQIEIYERLQYMQRGQSISEVRQKRHQKLMRLISSYSLSTSDKEYLIDIKRQTELEIDFRFMKSRHNHEYVFPLNNQGQKLQISREQGHLLNSGQSVVYNLYAQQQLEQSLSKHSHRVKSLDSQKIHYSSLNSKKNRPEQRSGRRLKVNLPTIQVSKHRTHKTEGVSPERYNSERRLKPLDPGIKVQLLKSEQYKNQGSARQLEEKQMRKRQREIGRILVTKLMTEQSQRISTDKTKLILQRLGKHRPPAAHSACKKMITE